MTNINTIAILGAGVMGLMSAHMLSREFPDAHITLFDPSGFPADNASFIAGGMLAPYSELDHMPHEFLPAGLESISLWNTCAKDLNADFEFSQRGSLIIAHDKDRHLPHRFKQILPEGDESVQYITDISAEEPDLSSQKFKSGLLLNAEAHLNPRLALTALSAAIQNKKAHAAQAQDIKNHYDLIIDCTGMNAKPSLPSLRGVKGEIAIVRNPEFSLSRPVRLMHPRYPLYIVPRADHIFLIGATIIESGGNNTVSLRSGMELLSALYSLHPSFGDAQILEIRAGIRPAFPDNLPRIIQRENVIYANGLYRHGFLFSPVMAQCICALARGEQSVLNSLFMKPA